MHHRQGKQKLAGFGKRALSRRRLRQDYDDDNAGMKTYRFAAPDKPVSAIGLDAQYFHPDNRRHNFAILDAFVASGGTYLDTAEVYGIAEDRGCSEKAIGQWLAARPGMRERVVLATKGLIPGYYGENYRDDVVITPEAVHQSIDDSISRLGVKYLDVWMFHRDSPELPVGPLVDALDEEISKGRVRAYGACNWSIARLQEALNYSRAAGKRGISLTSPAFSLAKPNEEYFRGTVSVDENDRQWLVRRRFPVVAWAPLGRGFFVCDAPKDRHNSGMARVFYSDDNFERKKRAEQLANKKHRTIADIALGYVINQEFPAIALSGAQSVREVEDAIAAGDVELSRAECQWLDLTNDRRPFR
ncbi:MAG: aldo/keto reductase [Gammaproteobacteria bacterium]